LYAEPRAAPRTVHRDPAREGNARPRIAALDAARALGVVAMVFGHTLDALLSPSARLLAGVQLYWKARGLTAPLFLLVAGWAVTAAIRRSGARGLDVVRGRAGRVALLLAVGYALRWPGWGVDRLRQGDHQVWAHLLAFDALHVIAVAIVVAAIVFAAPWSARTRVVVLSTLAAAAVAAGSIAPLVAPVEALPQNRLALAVAQAAGGSSPFPLLPWIAYFLAGCVLGVAVGDCGRRAPAWTAAAGATLVAATAWTGVGEMPPGDPRLVAFRVGAVLVVLAALSAVPARWAARAAPLGRASLGVYGVHVAFVYGWSTWEGLATRIGPTLSLGRAALAAAVVLGASVVAERALRVAIASARWAWDRWVELADLLAEPR
jgi:acyltransferase